MFRLLIFASVVTWSLAVTGQEPSKWQATQTPSFGFQDIIVAKINKVDDKPVLIANIPQYRPEVKTRSRKVTSFVAETRTRAVDVDGKQVEEKYLIQVPVTKIVTESYMTYIVTDRIVNKVDPKIVQAWNREGKPVLYENLLLQLKKAKHVIMVKAPVTKENIPSPYYTSVMKEDMLFLLLPGP